MMNQTNGENKKQILFLAAPPGNDSNNGSGREYREITEALKRSRLRDAFDLENYLDIGRHDVRRAMLDYDPHIIHFCGHSGKDENGTNGLRVRGEGDTSEIMHPEPLAELLGLFKNVECVVLSGCYTEEMAAGISEKIPYVVGIVPGALDTDAVNIITAFYDGVVNQKTYEFSARLADVSDLQVSREKLDSQIEKRFRKIVNPKLPGYQSKLVTLTVQSFYKDYAKQIDRKHDLKLDLCQHFDNDRHLVNGEWQEIDKKVRDFLDKKVILEDRYRLYLPLHTSLVFQVGRFFHGKMGVELGIYQPTKYKKIKLWEIPNEPDGWSNEIWNVEKQEVSNTGGGVAAAVSVSRPTLESVKSYVKKHRPDISKIIHLEIKDCGQLSIKNSTHAIAAADKAVQILDQYCRECLASRLHLFISAPNIFTFMMGQHSHVLSNLTQYEFLLGAEYRKTKIYEPAVMI
jgi:hypothetical protein